MEKLVLEPSHELCRKLDSREKKTYGYLERDDSQRQEFMKELATLALEQLVYVDEAGMDIG
jgi:hypothetical protein